MRTEKEFTDTTAILEDKDAGVRVHLKQKKEKRLDEIKTDLIDYDFFNDPESSVLNVIKSHFMIIGCSILTAAFIVKFLIDACVELLFP